MDFLKNRRALVVYQSKMEKKPKHFINQPTYPGGPKAMSEFIYKNLRYPKQAAAAKLEGTVLLRIEINSHGIVSDVQVLKGIGLGCDEEAARVVRLFKFDVAKNRGLRVLFHRDIRVQFKMAKAVPLPVLPEMPAPQGQQMVLNYSITTTPAAPAAKKEEPKKSGGSYSYSISVG